MHAMVPHGNFDSLFHLFSIFPNPPHLAGQCTWLAYQTPWLATHTPRHPDTQPDKLCFLHLSLGLLVFMQRCFPFLKKGIIIGWKNCFARYLGSQLHLQLKPRLKRNNFLTSFTNIDTSHFKPNLNLI